MANLAKLDFHALDISGNNFMSWALDAEMHLEAQNLGSAIKEDGDATPTFGGTLQGISVKEKCRDKFY